MSKPTCQTCVAFVASRGTQGQCHLSPPTLLGLGMEKVNIGGRVGSRPLVIAAWPDVPGDGWCYKHIPTAEALKAVFDAAKLRPSGAVEFLDGSVAQPANGSSG